MAKAENQQHTQAERLKALLKSMGIHSERDLDKALDNALDGLTIGIMTNPATQSVASQKMCR